MKARLGVASVFFANGFGVGAWAVAIPAIKADYRLSDGALSVALLLVAAGAITAMPFGGLAVPRFGGTGRALRLSTPAFALTMAALPLGAAVSPGLSLLGPVAFLFGIFNGLMDVPMNAHAANVEKAWRAPIMSSFHAAWSAGGLAGSAIGAWLIHSGASAGVQLGVEAALALAVAWPWTFLIGVGDRAPDGHAFAWPERRLLAFGAIAALGMMIEGSATDWSGVYLRDDLGLAPDRATVGYVGYALAMLGMRLVGDRVVARLGRMPTVMAGAAVVAAGVALVVGPYQGVAAIVGFWLVGAGVANMVPTVFGAGAEAAGGASTGIATTATVGYSGFLLGPPLIGAVAQA
ncbi:MAG: MFS transporter, partial [Hyphomicrobiales bacterium]|nr:MFS transporter [Hyphomicrobiales bacterium]